MEILFFIAGELDINPVKCHLYIMVATIIKENIFDVKELDGFTFTFAMGFLQSLDENKECFNFLKEKFLFTLKKTSIKRFSTMRFSFANIGNWKMR